MKHYTALIIEDDPDDRELLKLELSKLDFKLDCKDVDSEAGLRSSLDEALPDIVISDYSMSGFTGLDALEIVREQKSDLPFILCSGLIGEEQAVDAVKNGVNDYCLKNNLERLGLCAERELKNYEEHKKKSRQLEKTKSQYKNLVQSVNGIVWEADAETFEFLYVSPKSHQFLGYSPEEWLGEPNFWQQHIHPEDRKKAIEFCHYKTQQGENHEFEYRMLDANGKVIWLRDYVTVVMENGKPNRLRGFMIDISREKTAERQRDKAYEIASIGHWELNLVNEELYWSNAVKNIHEVDPDYKPNLEAALGFYKEGEYRQKITRVVENAIKTGESFEVELQIIAFNGNEKWVRVVGETEFRNRECKRIYGSTQDISKRKEREEKLEELALVASKTTDVIFMTDPHERITWVNNAFEQFSGYQFDEVIGKSPGHILTGPDNNQETMKRISNAFKKQEALQVVVLNYSRTGDKYWFDLTLDPIFDGNGHCDGFIGIQTDVTNQIKHQQELSKSIERYEIVSKATRDTIWDWNLETDTIEYSQNFYDMFGFEQQQVDEIEDWWRDKIHPDDRSRVFENIEKAQRASSERFQIEYRFQAADGSYKYIYDRAFMVEDQEGNPIRVIGAMRDVSEQKEAHNKMKEAFQERERILERISEAFFAVDQNWNVTYWNKQAEEVIGVTRVDVLGKNLWEKFPVAKEGQFYTEYKRAFQEQVPVQFEEYYHPLKQWLEVNAYPSDEGLSVFFRDITQRKESDQALQEQYQRNRLVLESTDEGIYGIDTEGLCTFINKASAHMLGYHAEECIGKNMHQLIYHQHPNGDPYPESECPIYISKNKHESCRVIDVFWRADGTSFNVEYTSNPMIKDGEIMGVVVAFSDITERKQKEKELQESLEEKETLLMEIHHRVKNNLAVISSMMQLQILNVDNEYVQVVLNDSIYRIKTMAMIHELLYKSPSFSRLNLNENIERLISRLSEAFDGYVKINSQFSMEPVELNINQAIPCMLLMNEVVTNILKHAFIGRKHGNISVEMFEKAEYLTLKITDNGVGLPDNFSSISKESSVGLILVETLADQLEAEYSYQSLDHGTLFTFSFKKADIQGIGNAHL